MACPLRIAIVASSALLLLIYAMFFSTDEVRCAPWTTTTFLVRLTLLTSPRFLQQASEETKEMMEKMMNAMKGRMPEMHWAGRYRSFVLVTIFITVLAAHVELLSGGWLSGKLSLIASIITPAATSNHS